MTAAMSRTPITTEAIVTRQKCKTLFTRKLKRLKISTKLLSGTVLFVVKVAMASFDDDDDPLGRFMYVSQRWPCNPGGHLT